MRLLRPALLALPLAAAAVLALAVPASADTPKATAESYVLANFATGRGTVQVAVDIAILLRDGPDADSTDDRDEVAAVSGAYRIQGLSAGIVRVQLQNAYLGWAGGKIFASEVGPRNNGTAYQTGNTKSADGNIWWGDAPASGEHLYCLTRLRVNWAARLDTGAIATGTLLSGAYIVPGDNIRDCMGLPPQ